MMPPMTAITLPPDLEAWARAEVAAGRAADIESFVAEALREKRDHQKELHDLLEEGRADIAAGRTVDGDVALTALRARAARLK
jgi:Arc/MetJ-type ribon-helix-helix transcriptional regulator